MMEEAAPIPRIPVSTYRLQFNHTFGFSEAAKLIPYLHALGITDVYASPYFKARQESLHGYDIVDPNALNPEVGSASEYERFVRELKKYGMGQIVDVIPNHMCIEGDNRWWMDILENGKSSPYADFFDIDWTPALKKLDGKVLIPLLGDQYGKTLERQELRLAFDAGSFFVHYFDNRFPILPDTYSVILEYRIEEIKKLFSENDPHIVELLSIITALNHLPRHTEKDQGKIVERHREKEIVKRRLQALCNESPEIKNFLDENVRLFNGVKNDPASFNLLDRLLNDQVWRLSYWRVATEEINYRRFFDINNMAAVHMEKPDVLRETHRLIFQLVSEGKVTGLRVDHPDGLYDPAGYFNGLQQGCFVQRARALRGEDSPPPGSELTDTEQDLLKQYDTIVSSDPQFKPFYIVVEKILSKGERIPDEWPIFGTTGYAFLNFLNGIFVDTRNARIFDTLYTRFLGLKTDYSEVVYEKKKLVTQVAMSGEINTLGHYLNKIAEKSRHTRDFTLNSLTKAITEVIVFFPVYRTYINSPTIKDKDRQYIEAALSRARRKNPAINTAIFDFIRDVLLLRFPEGISEDDKREWLDFVMRSQQMTAPVMAKGIEDTAFYVYNRLISLNEVGGSPERFGASMDAFHGQNIERKRFWPHALLATSTHDTKRSEDVRARINVLSEMPEKWKERLRIWSRLNKKKKTIIDGQAVPDRNEEYLLYQTLIGAWPAAPMGVEEYGAFKERIRGYMLKAVREAKINSSWISPDAIYEDAVIAFVDAIMTSRSNDQFLKEFMPFQKQIQHYGMLNSLSQALLKVASPGIPDSYQGSEIWDFSLVDPDNRRPVDYDKRMKLLNELKSSELTGEPSRLARELTRQMDDGKVKLYLVYKALNFRKDNKELFEGGEYIPIEAAGEKAYFVCAFARRTESSVVLAVAPRFFTQLVPDAEGLPIGTGVWRETQIIIPFEKSGANYRNIFTGEGTMTESVNGSTVLNLSLVFSNFPVALMSRE